MHIDNISTNWNYGLGLYPISNYLRLSNKNKNVSIEHTFESIPDNPADIIVYGDIESNINDLLFLLAGLMFKGIFVSIINNGHNIPILSTLPHNRKIICADTQFLRYKLEELITPHLTESDILILKVNNIGDLRRIRKMLIKNRLLSKIMFDCSELPKQRFLDESEIYDIHPYEGSIEIFE